jgi:hypothetical protein
MKSPSEETERRRPVWEALSDLFLDTELDSRDLQGIAHILARSGYDDDELATILYYEVYPVCISNLVSTAGEWGLFDGSWLQNQILANENRPWMTWRVFQWGRWMIRDDWQKILEILSKDRKNVEANNNQS